MQKNETRPLPYTTHKNQLKMDNRLKPKAWNHKTSTRNIASKPLDIGLGDDIFDLTPKA